MKKLRKSEKRIVNGAGDVQYVSLEFLTPHTLQALFAFGRKSNAKG